MTSPLPKSAAGRSRQILSSLAGELVACRQRVPLRCRGFAQLVAEVEREISSCDRRWWPLWLSEAELTRLEQRTTELRAAAPSFAELAKRLESLEGKLRHLRGEESRAPDAEARAWFSTQVDGWIGALAPLGAAQRPAELAQEVRRLGEVEAEVRLAEESLTVLGELARARAALPRELAVAPLAAQLEALRKDGLTKGASAAWLSRARRFLAPLVPSGPAPAAVGPSQDVIALLTQLQSWGGATGLMEPEIAALAPRLRRDPQAAAELEPRARELLAQLLSAAATSRDEQRRHLEHDLAALVRGCGRESDQNELETGLEQLIHHPMLEPADHESWRRLLSTLRHKLENLATLRAPQLLAAMVKRVEAAQGALGRLAALELPEELENERRRAAGLTQAFAEISTWPQALAQLAAADQIVQDLARLEAQADRERATVATLETRRTSLKTELDVLGEAALRPQERALRDNIRAELEALAPAPKVSSREAPWRRHRQLEPAIQRGEELLERLRLGEERVRALEAELLARLETFLEADLPVPAPALLDRAEGLIQGARLGGAGRPWAAIEEQLVAAELLLSRLERHGLRLAATRTTEIAQQLERHQAGRREAAPGREVDELLAQLASSPPQTLPPARWRRKAEDWLRRRGGEARRGGRE